jgi:molybdenum cofactor cytidylyltransferase
VTARRVSPRVAAVVLAAGTSSRMGAANKLTLEIGGEPVIARAVDAALASRAATVVVVTGYQAARVRAALAGRDVAFAHNRYYAQGLSSSLRRGVKALDPEIEGALICLGDMPWISPRDLDALIAAFAHTARPICVPVRGRRRGNPILWPARHFAALRALQGDLGARGLVRRHAREVVRVSVPGAGILRDVDTSADFVRPPSRPGSSPRRRA